MTIQAGLVGLPNVGKSTLFNALTKSQIPAENYPFCTIDPNKAIVPVPDPRLKHLAQIYGSKTIIPASVTFVDIAGLVKGAASGEGLGNKFLSHIQTVDLILHIVRCFEDPDIIRSEAQLDPYSDYEVIIAELMLKDLETVAHRREKLTHLLKKTVHDKPVHAKHQAEMELLEQITGALDQANPEKVKTILELHGTTTVPLLCAKKFLIIANLSESDVENEAYKHNSHYLNLIDKFGIGRVVPVSAKIEYELSQLTEDEASEMRSLMDIKAGGLDQIIQRTYTNLGLISFFTCGPQETHAWQIKNGTSIRQAAGEIHSDLERGFICAEIFNYNDLITSQSVAKLKDMGKVRIEGEQYIVQDGDIVHVRFNV